MLLRAECDEQRTEYRSISVAAGQVRAANRAKPGAMRLWRGLLAVVAALLVVCAASSAWAQDRTTEIAREKFEQGVAAYDAGEYEKARTLFLQAYAMKRHPLVLLNLGQSELKGGHPEEAGNHLQQFLRDHKDPTADQKQAAEAGIAEAQKKTGYIILIVDTDGAKLAVDGVDIGESPLADSYFVSPGKHEASATKGGKTVKTEVEVKKGTATPVTLTLGGAGAVTPVPGPTPNPTGPAPMPTYPQPTNPMPPPYPVAPNPMPPMGTPPGGDSGREGLWPWFKKRPLAWALFGVASVSFVGTFVFGGLAAQRNTNASDLEDQIIAEVQRGEDGKTLAKLPPQFWSNGDGTGQPQPCGRLDSPGTGFAHYADHCGQLRNELDAYDDMLIGVAVMVPVFVLSTTGLAVYYVVDSDKGGSSSGTLLPVPIITPTVQGAGLVGTF